MWIRTGQLQQIDSVLEAGRSSDYELNAAWDLIRGIYPGLDPATSKAIEGTLCQFDVI